MVDASIKKHKFTTVIHSYKLVMLSRSSKMDINMELQKYQDDIINSIVAKRTGIETMKTTLSSNAKFILEKEENKKMRIKTKHIKCSV